jgi:hypothetical protein
MKKSKPSTLTYTCTDYREEMILLGLRKQLENQGLTKEERQQIEKEILRLEKIIGF